MRNIIMMVLLLLVAVSATSADMRDTLVWSEPSYNVSQGYNYILGMDAGLLPYQQERYTSIEIMELLKEYRLGFVNNSSEYDIILSPNVIHFQLYKAADGGYELIYDYAISTFAWRIPARFGLAATVPYDDPPLTEGSYKIKFSESGSFEYQTGVGIDDLGHFTNTLHEIARYGMDETMFDVY